MIKIETKKNQKIWPLIFFYFFAIAILNLPGQVYFLLPIVTTPIRILQILLLFSSVAMLLLKNETPNIGWLLVVIFYVFTYGSEFLLRTSTSIRLSTPITIIALCTVTCLGLRRHRRALCTGYFYFFLIVAVLQILIMLSRPDLLVENEEYGLFENRNYLVRFFLPGACFAMMASYEKHGRMIDLSTAIYLFLIACIVVMCGSATGTIGLFTFILLACLFSKKQLPRLLSVNKVLLYTVAFFLLIYFFNIQEKFEFLIVDILEKDITFTGRTRVWDRAMELIRHNPLIGIGESPDLRRFLGASHAHQYWLHLLVTGGVVGCFVVFLLYFFAGKNLLKHPNSKLFIIISIALIGFLIMGIDESLMGSTMLFPLLVVACEKKETVYTNLTYSDQTK